MHHRLKRLMPPASIQVDRKGLYSLATDLRSVSCDVRVEDDMLSIHPQSPSMDCPKIQKARW